MLCLWKIALWVMWQNGNNTTKFKPLRGGSAIAEADYSQTHRRSAFI